ncbi:MAG: hypothetical protein ACOYXS_09085 [Chloroflexota bacterium]
MPFGFGRGRKDEPRPAAASPGATAGRRGPVAFDGLTEEWRLVGFMEIEGRLSDALNRRQPIHIHDVRWAPIDGSEPFTPAPGLGLVDPYDLIIVLAGEDTLPLLTEEEKAAHRVHKVPYDVALEVPPFRVIGTVYLHPGSDPGRLLERGTDMFVPVNDAVALLGERQVNDPAIGTILVNRFYLRGVEQVDKRTRTRAEPLPGRPLGGVSWRDTGR